MSIEIDTKITKFMCEWCKTSFTHEHNLKTHVKSAKYCLKMRAEILENDDKNKKSGFSCEYCDSSFTQKINLNQHYNICKKKVEVTYLSELSKLREEYEKKNSKMKKQYKAQINEEKDERDKMEIILQNQNKLLQNQSELVQSLTERNNELEKQLAKEQGCIIGMEKAKPIQTINNNGNTMYVHPKLANINIETIRPLTIETVQEDMHKLTFHEFCRGIQGLIDFILNIIIYPPPIDLDNRVIEYSESIADSEDELTDEEYEDTKGNDGGEENSENDIDEDIDIDYIIDNCLEDIEINLKTDNIEFIMDNYTNTSIGRSNKLTPATKFTQNHKSIVNNVNTNINITNTVNSAIASALSELLPQLGLVTTTPILKGGKQQNLVCTDNSRHAFYRLEKPKKWEIDGKAEFLHKIFDALFDTVTDYRNRLSSEIERYNKIFTKTNNKIINLCKIKNLDQRFLQEKVLNVKKELILQKIKKGDETEVKIAPIYYGITMKEGQDRKDLFNTVRAEIKKFVAV